jgi:hypothetical protein
MECIDWRMKLLAAESSGAYIDTFRKWRRMMRKSFPDTRSVRRKNIVSFDATNDEFACLLENYFSLHFRLMIFNHVRIVIHSKKPQDQRFFIVIIR